MKRRQFIAAVAGTAAASLASGSTRRGFRKAYADIAQPGLPSDGATLLSAPIELAGDWGRMIPNSAKSVVERMRDACLDGIRLMSDRQPLRLRVEERKSGPPAVWLHDDRANMAWIIVDIGDRDWSKLAYQFGHELGHVLANSWDPDAKPAPPCQWVEEALWKLCRFGALGGWREAGSRIRHFPATMLSEIPSPNIGRISSRAIRARRRAGADPGRRHLVHAPPPRNRGRRNSFPMGRRHHWRHLPSMKASRDASRPSELSTAGKGEAGFLSRNTSFNGRRAASSLKRRPGYRPVCGNCGGCVSRDHHNMRRRVQDLFTSARRGLLRRGRFSGLHHRPYVPEPSP